MIKLQTITLNAEARFYTCRSKKLNLF